MSDVTYERIRAEHRLDTGRRVVGYPVDVDGREYGVVTEVREGHLRRGWVVYTWSGRIAVTVDDAKRIGPAMRDALAMLRWKLDRAAEAAA